jgi:hypothetical protein
MVRLGSGRGSRRGVSEIGQPTGTGLREGQAVSVRERGQQSLCGPGRCVQPSEGAHSAPAGDIVRLERGAQPYCVRDDAPGAPRPGRPKAPTRRVPQGRRRKQVRRRKGRRFAVLVMLAVNVLRSADVTQVPV